MTTPADDAAAARRSLTPGASGDVRTITVERTYPTDADDLWHAVTDADRLTRWIGPASGDLRLGGHYQLEGNAGGTVEACHPPTSYALSWEFDGEVSHVRVRVTEADPGATLRIEHDAPPNEHWEKFGPAATGIGWEGALRGLAISLSTGAALDPAEQEAWATSDDGIAYTRACGERWAEATVAAGDDPAWARAAAQRTVDFYTGAAG